MSDKTTHSVIIEVGFHSVLSSNIGSINLHEGNAHTAIVVKPSVTVNHSLSGVFLSAGLQFETLKEAQEKALQLRNEWRAAISRDTDVPEEDGTA